MNITVKLWVLLAVTLVSFAPGSFGQLNVQSDGSDGVLNITTSTNIDLSIATNGVWSQSNSGNAGHGVYDPAKWAVVFKYASVNIASNCTVTFSNHPTHAPVVWLVQSNVTINGTVSLNGRGPVSAYPDRLFPTEPGPGGFRGGAGDPIAGSGAGFGVGGGSWNSGEVKSQGASYGTGYGNPQALPLLGGSGASGLSEGGVSGGGAMLIAAGESILVGGSITAIGVNDDYDGGFGYDISGGGAIRLVANSVQGSGSVSAAVIRTEANSISPQLVLTPNTIRVPPGTTPAIFPPASAPVVAVVSVNGVSAPADPLAAVSTSSDMNISTNNPVDILLQSQNFPPSGSVVLRVTPKYANYFNVTATFMSGTFTQALWKATTTLPNGFCVLQAHATSP